VKDELKIGVFICDCHGQIASAIDMKEISSLLSNASDISTVTTLPYGCSPDGEEAIKESIQTDELNRVVLLGCSPRMMEKRFRNVCSDAGLNPSLLEIVNLRDQCAWVHQNSNGAATRKAWSMVQAGLGRARKLTPVEPASVKIRQEAAVVGGGTAGMTAALSLAERGVSVMLIEKSKVLGGGAQKLAGSTPQSRETKDTLERLVTAVQSSTKIAILTESEITNISGTYGDYRLTLKSSGKRRTIKCGAIILATSTKELDANGYHGHGDNPKVIAQSEFERKMADESELSGIQNVVMIQCVGARNEERPYCGRTCCLSAVNNAIALKEAAPHVSITILHRDMPAEPGPDGVTLNRAGELGIKFVRMSDEMEPKVAPKTVSGERSDASGFRIPYDLVVLSTPQVAREVSRQLAEKLRIPIDEFGFIPDTLPNLKPHMYTPPAIHTAGSAHWPCTSEEASAQGYSRAARVAKLVQAGEVTSVRDVAQVNIDSCRGCETCYDVCPFDVPVIKPINGSDPVSTIDPFLCKGCGLCVVHCPTGTAVMTNLDDDTIYATIEAALSAPAAGTVKTVAFLCEWSGYAAADLSGVKRHNLPSEVIPIRIPCAARLSTGLVLQSFLHGADGVIACVCGKGDCHYLTGNSRAEEMVAETENLINLLGIDRDCFQMVRTNPEDYKEFAKSLDDFIETIKNIQASSPVSTDEKAIEVQTRQSA